jgi:hypothetical protein
MSPKERKLRARLAAHTSWANTGDRSARTAPAREAAMSRFERQVDPDGTMNPTERALRADAARRAHFASMAYKAARSRARNRAGAENGDGA